MDDLKNFIHVPEFKNAHTLAEFFLELFFIINDLVHVGSSFLLVHLLSFNKIKHNVLLNICICQHHASLSLSSNLIQDILNDLNIQSLSAVVAKAKIKEHSFDLLELQKVMSRFLKLLGLILHLKHMVLISSQILGFSVLKRSSSFSALQG